MRLGGQPQRAHLTQVTGSSQRWESERWWSASQPLYLLVTGKTSPGDHRVICGRGCWGVEGRKMELAPHYRCSAQYTEASRKVGCLSFFKVWGESGLGRQP